MGCSIFHSIPIFKSFGIMLHTSSSDSHSIYLIINRFLKMSYLTKKNVYTLVIEHIKKEFGVSSFLPRETNSELG